MKASICTVAVLVFVLAAWPTSAQCPADTTTTTPDDYTCYVADDDTGSDANPGTRSSPMRTIQGALDRVADGTELGFQIVRVLPGTYDECPFAGSVGIPGDVEIVADDFLTGGVNTTTIVDGTVCVTDGWPVFELGDNSKLRGFTIKKGGYSGVLAFGHVTIANNIIEDNSSPDFGGGIRLETGADVSTFAEEARIERNTIRDNTAVAGGGGMYIYAPGDGLPSKVIVDANTVINNTAGPLPVAANDSVFGGGIAVFADSLSGTDRSEVVITSNTIEGNEAEGIDSFHASFGGGLSVATFGEGTETVEVKTTNIVRNNKATFGYGGGIAALGQGIYPGTVAHDVLVQSNAVSGNTATFGGGGIYAKTLSLDLDGDEPIVVRVLANEVSGNGITGAADQSGVSGGGGIFADYVNERTAGTAIQLTVDGNTLRNNTSASFGGGASLWIRTFGEPETAVPPGPLPASSLVRFANNLVTGNSAHDTQTDFDLGEGGGVYVLSLGQGGGASSADVKFNTVADNTADVGRAGGVAIRATNVAGSTSGIGSTTVEVSNSIFLSNSGYAIGGDAVPGLENTTVRIAYNDTFDNGAGPFAPQYTTTAGPGNITADPELDAFFVPPLCSPTIDAGDPAEGTLGGGGLQEERQPNGRIANLGHTGLTLNATVTLPDATGDALVDGVDILRLATSFASSSSNVARYNAAADIDKNGIIDGSDLSYMSAWFGKACP